MCHDMKSFLMSVGVKEVNTIIGCYPHVRSCISMIKCTCVPIGWTYSTCGRCTMYQGSYMLRCDRFTLCCIVFTLCSLTTTWVVFCYDRTSNKPPIVLLTVHTCHYYSVNGGWAQPIESMGVTATSGLCWINYVKIFMYRYKAVTELFIV